MSDIQKTPVSADAAAFAAARPAVARPATPRLRRERPAASKDAAKRLVPAASSFDLLSGEYLKKRKSRLLALFSLGAAGLVLILFSAQLLRIRLEIIYEKSRYAEAVADAAAAKAALDQLAQFEGVPSDIVEEVLVARAAHAAAATETEVDIGQIVQEITSLATQGVEVTSISLDPAVLEVKKKATKQGEDASQEAASPLFAIVTVHATAESYQAITPFLERMRASENLNDFKESWSGEPPLLRLVVGIKVRVASSDRYLQFVADAGIIETEPVDENTAETTPTGEGD
jgi:hypothetical protein